MVKKVIVNYIKKFIFNNNKNILKKDTKNKNKGVPIMNKEGSYNALDIAQYVINYSIQKYKPVSNLKLQKLLYYIQAAFIVEQGVPCFKEDIINWRHGPVIKEVYDEYKDYINSDITEIQNGYYILDLDRENLKFISKFQKFNPDKISKKDKELINRVIDGYLNIDAWELVRRTHNEKPWKEDSVRYGIITVDSIKNYFEYNKHRIFGGY